MMGDNRVEHRRLNGPSPPQLADLMIVISIISIIVVVVGDGRLPLVRLWGGVSCFLIVATMARRVNRVLGVRTISHALRFSLLEPGLWVFVGVLRVCG